MYKSSGERVVPTQTELPDYYALLGIDRAANESEIHRAYRRRVAQWHPDRHHGRTADLFKLFVEAHETLSKPLERLRYDLLTLGLVWRHAQGGSRGRHRSPDSLVR